MVPIESRGACSRVNGGAAMLGSPYGWLVIVAFVLIALALFGIIFR